MPAVVIVPTRSHTNALKARLLAAGHSHLGLHFLTPASLRARFVTNQSVPRPAPEHLRLLLASAAEETARLPNEVDQLAAKAVIRAPDHLLRTLERLDLAGWDFQDLHLPSFRPIVHRFREHLRACGFELTASRDRAAAESARSRPPQTSSLLVFGFDGAHWPLWFSLQAAVHAAEETLVILHHPREEARDLDEAWIGTWEESYGAAKPIASSRKSETLFPELLEPELFSPTAVDPSVEKHFLVGRTVSNQAQAIAALVECFLASGAADRIGVLFPAPGALPRCVGALLADAKILHYDGIAHLAPGPLEDDAWPAWLELQESPRLRILLRFLRASPAACGLFGGLDADRIEDVLQRASRNLLIDDLPLLRAYCASFSKPEHSRAHRRGTGCDSLPSRTREPV